MDFRLSRKGRIECFTLERGTVGVAQSLGVKRHVEVIWIGDRYLDGAPRTERSGRSGIELCEDIDRGGRVACWGGAFDQEIGIVVRIDRVKRESVKKVITTSIGGGLVNEGGAV